MRTSMVLVVASLLFSVACSQPSKQNCAQDAKAVAALVRDLNVDSTGAADPSLSLVKGDDKLARLPSGLTSDVHIDGAGKMFLFGREIPSEGAASTFALRLAKHLEKEAVLAGVVSNLPPNLTNRPLVLAVHPDAPWASVVEALQARPPNLDARVRWLFRLPARASEPTATWVRASIADKDVKARSKALADASAKLSATCPSFRALLTSMQKRPAAQHARTLEAGIEAALVTCTCDLEMPALKDLLFVTLNASPAGYVETLVPHNQQGTPLSAPAAERFKQVAVALRANAAGGAPLVPTVGN